MSTVAQPTPLCPLCDYNLSGIPIPRCPECGHTFEWADLTDPTRMSLKWFFEHRRFLGGYFRTQFQLFAHPISFWKTLRPSHRLVPRRTILFFLLGFFALFFPIALFTVGASAIQIQTGNLAQRKAMLRPVRINNPPGMAPGQPVTRPMIWVPPTSSTTRQISPVPRPFLQPRPTTLPAFPSTRTLRPPTTIRAFPYPPGFTQADINAMGTGMTRQAWLDSTYPIYGCPAFGNAVLAILKLNLRPLRMAVFLLAFPLAALLVLAIMRQTFSRVKIKPAHTLRVALYTSDFLPFALLVFLPIVHQFITLRRNNTFSYFDLTLSLICLFAIILWLIRLSAALKHYLAVPHRPAILIVTLLIASLTALTLAANLL